MKRYILIVVFLVMGCSNNTSQNNTKADSLITTIESEINSSDTSTNQNIEELIEQYEDPGRVNWQHPDLILNKLGNLDGKTVADIGAGSGYFTFRLINDADKVIAIDIEKEMLDFIDERKSGLNNEIANKLVTRLVNPDDPGLELEEADYVLIVNTYLNIENREDYLKKLIRGIKSGGKLLIVDFKKGILPTGPPDQFKVDPSVASDELITAGFENIDLDSLSLNYQYIILSTKP